jgi:sugar lactone lactonase YvrE
MHNVAVGADDSIYISDSWNHCIRKIDAKTRVITTIAGTGKVGFSGDGGPADKATFNFLMCITFNKGKDKIYIADLNNRRIRVMDLKTGVVQTIAGNGKQGIPKDGASATDSPLVDPRAVTVDSKNNVYILERGGHALRLVTPDGKITTVAGTGKAGYKDGPALQGQLSGPKHLCVDDQDNVFIADDKNGAVRKYDPVKKTLSTVVGRKLGTPPIELLNPHGVCFHKGTLYVVDTGHHRILKVQ